MELDRTKQRSRDDHDSFSTENQELIRKIEELKVEIVSVFVYVFVLFDLVTTVSTACRLFHL